MWVELRYTPIEVTKEDDGSLSVHVEETAEEVAKEEAKMGCWFCYLPLNTETFETECIELI